MKSDWICLAQILLVLFFVVAKGDVQDGAKTEVNQKSSDSNNEESEEQVAMEDLENAFEQLRELKALRDTLMKLVPTGDSLLSEKLSKEFLSGDKKDETEKGEDDILGEDKETSKSWIKSEQSSEDDKKEDDEESGWENVEQDRVEETVPLTPEQQEGGFF